MAAASVEYFSERQRFRQLWLWILVLSVDALMIFLLVNNYQKEGDDPAKALIILSFGIILSNGFLWIIHLDTIIRNDGICYRYFPLQWNFKFIPWEDISKAYIRSYKPIREYGGWGIRFGLAAKGMAYNISGNKGLQLVLINGRSILIGTQHPLEMEQALLQLNKFAGPGGNNSISK